MNFQWRELFKKYAFNMGLHLVIYMSLSFKTWYDDRQEENLQFYSSLNDVDLHLNSQACES